MHVPLGGGQPEHYLLKPVHRSESKEHFFLVKAVEEYLKQFTNDIELKASSSADIIFKANKKTWAFEIETGVVMKRDPKKFTAKVNALNEKYGQNWLFIVTRSEYSYTYAKHGATFTRKTIPKRIRMIFKASPKSPPETIDGKPPKKGKITPRSPSIKGKKKQIMTISGRKKRQNKPKIQNKRILGRNTLPLIQRKKRTGKRKIKPRGIQK